MEVIEEADLRLLNVPYGFCRGQQNSDQSNPIQEAYWSKSCVNIEHTPVAKPEDHRSSLSVDSHPRPVERKHIERAEHIYREMNVIEACHFFARSDARKLFIGFAESSLNKMERLKFSKEAQENLLQLAERIGQSEEQIMASEAALDDLSDEDLHAHAQLVRFAQIFEEQPQSGAERQIDLSTKSGLRRLIAGLKDKDPQVICEFAEYIVDTLEKLSTIKSSLGEVGGLWPILFFQRLISWRNLGPELAIQAARFKKGEDIQNSIRDATKAKLAFTLAQIDDDGFEIALKHARAAQAEATRELFPSKEEYCKHHDSLAIEKINATNQMADILRKGVLTKFMADHLSGSSYRAFCNGLLLLNRSNQLTQARKIYG